MWGPQQRGLQPPWGPLRLSVHYRVHFRGHQGLGHPLASSPLQPQLWVLLNTPFPP